MNTSNFTPLVFLAIIILTFSEFPSPASPLFSNYNLPKDSMYKVKTGGIKMITVSGNYKVWTKKIGNGKIKVLLLHGGPGFSHDYFECFEDFLPGQGIQFYYYDQLGSGYSDVPTDFQVLIRNDTQ